MDAGGSTDRDPDEHEAAEILEDDPKQSGDDDRTAEGVARESVTGIVVLQVGTGRFATNHGTSLCRSATDCSTRKETIWVTLPLGAKTGSLASAFPAGMERSLRWST
jgi:hypothetical protein